MRMRPVIAFASFALLSAHATTVSAQMHKCQSRDGRTSYQDEPCPPDAKAGTVRRPDRSPDMAASPAAKPGAGAGTKRKPEEDKALGNLVVIASVQKDCHKLVGRYVSIDEMRKGCAGKSMSMQLARENDPSGDADYDYRMSASATRFELSVSPRRAGLAGYFTDSQNLYENPSGTASGQSRLVGPLPYF
ncbi:MAG: DUF4124 domain-containing protein [Lysobacter sp.]|nr:DUF4124 domain-containing protein [Lysobacter sp.]